MAAAISANGTLVNRAIMRRDFFVTQPPTFLMMLCEKTVPMASIAPSQVDIDAATIPTKHQAPSTGGASCVRSLRKARLSGFQRAQVGSSRIVEHV